MSPRPTIHRPLKLFFSYAHEDEPFRSSLDIHLQNLRRQGLITSWHDREISPGTDWQKQIDEHLNAAHIILLLVSPDFIASNYCYDIEMTRALERHDAGQARVVPIILRSCDWEESPFGKLQALPSGGKPVTSWRDRDEVFAAVAQGIRAVAEEILPTSDPEEISPSVLASGTAGRVYLETGAMPINSPFFVPREAFDRAVQQLESPQPTVTLRGFRQSGKSSLLVRLHHRAIMANQRSCYLNFQNFDAASYISSEQLFLEMARMMTDELDIDISPDKQWSKHRGAKANLTRFMDRYVLPDGKPILLLLDEVDLVFEHRACSLDLFSMLRSWHNKRAEDLKGRWPHLGLVIAHATDPTLWIGPDRDQSPFNVGLRLLMEDFETEQVAELNRRYETPLEAGEVTDLMDLVGGHPFLVRLALYILVTEGLSIQRLEEVAMLDGGPFSPYLRQYLSLLLQDSELSATLRQVLDGRGCDNESHFQQLWKLGVIRGETREQGEIRCRLYYNYFRSRL